MLENITHNILQKIEKVDFEAEKSDKMSNERCKFVGLTEGGKEGEAGEM